MPQTKELAGMVRLEIIDNSEPFFFFHQYLEIPVV